jgi:hypothetical protein
MLCFVMECHNSRPDTTPPPAHPFLHLNGGLVTNKVSPLKICWSSTSFMICFIMEVPQQTPRHHSSSSSPFPPTQWCVLVTNKVSTLKICWTSTSFILCFIMEVPQQAPKHHSSSLSFPPTQLCLSYKPACIAHIGMHETK